MTKTDLEIVSDLVNKVRNGTQVKIYDNAGNLNCFALENVIDIQKDQLRPALSHIYVMANTGCFTELDYDNVDDSTNCIDIIVSGSVNKWKKLLKFDKVNVLNCD